METEATEGEDLGTFHREQPFCVPEIHQDVVFQFECLRRPPGVWRETTSLLFRRQEACDSKRQAGGNRQSRIEASRTWLSEEQARTHAKQKVEGLL